MWVEETKNGKFKFVERYTDYMTGQVKKVSVTLEKNTTQSRKVAQKALDEKVDKAMRTKPKASMNLQNLVKEYQEYQEPLVKQSTYRRNCFACKTIMDILGSGTLLNRITANHVRTKLLASKKEASTLNELLIRFKALIRWGYYNDYIDNISFINKLEPFTDSTRREKVQDKYMESGELKALLTQMSVNVWRGVTQFLALTGLRIGELIALEKNDIDLDGRLIRVTKTFDTNNEVTTSTKTLTSTRDVFIQDELLPVVKELKVVMLQQKVMYGYDTPELFLTDVDGSHLKYDAYRKYLREKSIKVLGRPITPHTLRHTHASLLLENGMDIDAISRRLGHEDSKVTKEIYLHITQKLKDRDNEKIAKIKII